MKWETTNYCQVATGNSGTGTLQKKEMKLLIQSTSFDHERFHDSQVRTYWSINGRSRMSIDPPGSTSSLSIQCITNFFNVIYIHVHKYNALILYICSHIIIIYRYIYIYIYTYSFLRIEYVDPVRTSYRLWCFGLDFFQLAFKLRSTPNLFRPIKQTVNGIQKQGCRFVPYTHYRIHVWYI